MTNKEAAKFIWDVLDGVKSFNEKGGKGLEALDLAIKALENKRPKGRWIYQPNHTHLDNVQKYHCSTNKCGWQQNYKTNFCPNCGADMRGDTE